MNKEQKANEVAILKDKLTRANNIIVTDHTGINVADITTLRRKLRQSGSEMRVTKNSLLKLAIKDTDLETLQRHFEGPTSVIFGYDDAAPPAKIIYESIKETEKPIFKSYFYAGSEYGYDFMKRIAQLPSREMILAGLIGTLDGVISRFISLLEAATRDFIGTVDALAEKRK